MLKPSTQLKLIQKESDLLIHPIRANSTSSFEVDQVPSTAAATSLPSNNGKISPIVLLMIVILAVIFFIFGCLHLLFRYLTERSPSRSLFQSNNTATDQQASSTSQVLQRQLQQLFRLHDSGLDQPYIDSLPVFYYKDVKGLKQQQFECAVCLSEFSSQDKLKLLPLCSHAFHINCIDPWLMSNSTCPLCRATLLLNNPSLSLPSSLTLSSDDITSNGLMFSESEDSNSITLDEDEEGEKRVYSIRLGKSFKTSYDDKNFDVEQSSKLDGRRCYSMGSYQYVVTHDSYVNVDLKLKGRDGDSVNSNGASLRGDSFSMSKIWLWSKKTKFQDHHDSKVGFETGLEQHNNARLDLV